MNSVFFRLFSWHKKPQFFPVEMLRMVSTHLKIEFSFFCLFSWHKKPQFFPVEMLRMVSTILKIEFSFLRLFSWHKKPQFFPVEMLRMVSTLFKNLIQFLFAYFFSTSQKTLCFHYKVQKRNTYSLLQSPEQNTQM